jgi:tetratricopeptide (TPR) repeat protein
MSFHSPSRRLAIVSLVSLALPLAACGQRSDANAATQLSFGVNMARRGLWQEALFRFREAERLDPRNPHVENNLGVAYEAAGDFDHALEYYKKAIALAPENRAVKANYTRFVEFYQGFKSKTGKSINATAASLGKGKGRTPAAIPPPPGSPNEPPGMPPLFPEQPPTVGPGSPNAPEPPSPPPFSP